MNRVRICRLLIIVACLVACLVVPALASRNVALAQPAPSPADESILGTVEVDGSGGSNLPPLPKLAMVPLISITDADSTVSYVVRHDLELSGQFQVMALNETPSGPFTRDVAIDLHAYGAKGAEYVVRTFTEQDKGVTHLIAEAFVTPKPGTPAPPRPEAGAPPPPPPKAAYRGVVDAKSNGEVRRATHHLVDELIGALTGRPGGFASQMTYARRAGQWQRAFVTDADGFDLRVFSPDRTTVTSPVFGYGGILFYSVSVDYAPFKVAIGPSGTVLPIALPGSVMGLSFSPDGKKAALATMSEGKSSLWVSAENGALQRVDAAPLANHPALGPLGKVAYVGGTPVQRVYVDGKAISPPGLMASAPVFCDSPEGLLVIFTVQVAGGADVIAMDSGGGRLRRLTQRQGSNAYPACSPDGRLVAFFSETKNAKTSGLYVMPVARPWLAKKIADETGSALHWARAAR
jgi:TolB protein